MNSMLGVTKDEEILNVLHEVWADDRDLAGFMSDEIVSVLRPLRIYWETVQNGWNSHLGELLVSNFLQEALEYEGDREAIIEYFSQRVEMLCKQVALHLPQTGEDEDAVKQRVENRDHATQHNVQIWRRKNIVLNFSWLIIAPFCWSHPTAPSILSSNHERGHWGWSRARFGLVYPIQNSGATWDWWAEFWWVGWWNL